MRKLVFGFTGQGSQEIGMGKDLYENSLVAKEVYDKLPERLRKISFQGPIKELEKTENLQPIMVAFQIAVIKILRKEAIFPDGAFGLSLGEISALYTAEVLSEDEALLWIYLRGKAMDKATLQTNTKMLAVITGDLEMIKEFLNKQEEKNHNAYIANYNSSKQIVIAGPEETIYRIQNQLKEKKIKSILLKVSGGFHTPFMEKAKKELKKEIHRFHFNPPTIDYYPNKTGKKYEKEEIKKLILEQITSPVLLYPSLQNMVKEGMTHFVEIGPGNVLTKIVQREFKNIKTKNISSMDELEEFINKEERWTKNMY